jgi:HAD superfamily phosphatase (TIGR01668 family)
MHSLLTPHLQLASVLDIDAVRLRSLDREGLLLDVDCTLKDHGALGFSEPVQAWVKAIRAEGIRLCLLSNGKPRRIGALARQLDLPFVPLAFKPLPLGCLRALRILGLSNHHTAIVGDQLLADILAGRLAGLFTILVRPTSLYEPWFTRVKRPLESYLLRRLTASPASEPARTLVNNRE